MEDKFSFSKQISFKPLLTSIFFGVMVGTVVYAIYPRLPIIWIILGIGAFLIESLVIYPLSLAKLYGLWSINPEGIRYYDFSTWQEKVRAIYLPLSVKESFLNLSDIKHYSVVSGEEILNSQNYLGGAMNQPLNRKAMYLVITSKSNKKLILNLSWTTQGSPVSDKEIDKTIDILNSKLL